MGVSLALAATVVFWASAFAGIRAGLGTYGPGEIALFRFLVASVTLGAIALVRRTPLPERRDVPAVFLAGFLAFTVYHVALNFGEVSVEAGSASVLINTAPIFTSLLAVTFLGERLRPLGWAGMAVSFCGAVLVSAGESKGFGLTPEAFLILVAALASSIYFVFQKPYLEKYGDRYFSFHIKDSPKLGSDRDAELGKGVVDLRGLLSRIKNIDEKFLYVEQETYPDAPIESVRRDYEYISKLEF